MPVESYKDYLAGLQRGQECRLTELRTKATKIMEIMGIEKGRSRPRRVATMFLGDDRYQLCQVISRENPQPIVLSRGIEPCRQEEPVTDLEEGEDLVPSTELAIFYPGGEVFINGKRADPKQNYVIDLASMTAILGLWNRVLESGITPSRV